MVGLQLHLIRHAKTEKIASTGNDFDRSLLPKGIKQAKALAAFLKNKKISEFLLCSSAKRTLETKKILEEKIRFQSSVNLEALYLASHLEILQLICQQQDAKHVWIIGHNEGISDLASYLTGNSIHMKTCAYICLMPTIDHWAHLTANSCLLADAFRPEIDD
jgi:phosphohistidine phosphatase